MGGRRTSRYKKTEEKFLAVFFDNSNCTMKQLAKKVGVARSTIYTHHHSARQILPDYEQYIMEKYNVLIEKKLTTKKVELKTLYLDILVFIVKHRQIFAMFLKFGDREIVIKMILKLKPKIKEPEKILKLCSAEIVEIIFEWGERGFLEKEINKVLSDMLYLTMSARKRLILVA